MGNNIFIKVVLTIIALELGIMIFKNNTSPVIIREANAGEKSEVVHAKYDMANRFNNAQQDVQKVEIVGINIGTGYDREFLPVKLYGYAQGRHFEVPYPLPVTVKP